MSNTHQLDPVKRARLRWRGRRGLLENDLIITRFLDAHEETLTDEEVDAFSILMELPDNDLLDLLLAHTKLDREQYSERKSAPDALPDEVRQPHVQALLSRLRAM